MFKNLLIVALFIFLAEKGYSYQILTQSDHEIVITTEGGRIKEFFKDLNSKPEVNSLVIDLIGVFPVPGDPYIETEDDVKECEFLKKIVAGLRSEDNNITSLTFRGGALYAEVLEELTTTLTASGNKLTELHIVECGVVEFSTNLEREETVSLALIYVFESFLDPNCKITKFDFERSRIDDKYVLEVLGETLKNPNSRIAELNLDSAELIVDDSSIIKFLRYLTDSSCHVRVLNLKATDSSAPEIIDELVRARFNKPSLRIEHDNNDEIQRRYQQAAVLFAILSPKTFPRLVPAGSPLIEFGKDITTRVAKTLVKSGQPQ